MRISRTVEYGFIAAVFIAQNRKDGRVIARTISKAHGISTEYLQQVLQHLAKYGILTSLRGPKGGFDLAKPATEITLLDIIEAIDGSVQASTGLTGEATKKAEKIFIDVSKTAKVSLAKVTIADVAGKK